MPREDDNEFTGLGRLFAALVDNAADEPRGRSRAGGLDFERLTRELSASSDPVASLATWAIQTAADEESCALERRLAERLRGCGIFDDALEMPQVRVVRPRTSGLFYLRVEDTQTTYGAMLRVLAIEAALNSALLCSAVLEDAAEASVEEVVRAEQRVARSIAAQAQTPFETPEGEPTRGEWHARRAIAGGIECLRLPYRLTARFRVNVAAGAAAIECDLAVPELMPKSCYVDGLGVVPASAAMRRRAATDYNLRLVVLLAAYAFAAVEELDEVWVAGVVDTASSHACYCSARFAREDLEGLDLTRIEPVSLLRFLCAEMDEADGRLSPVRQGFSLEDELFCPPERYASVELGARRFSGRVAELLGCSDVRGLAARQPAALEEAGRRASARLGDTTAANVRAVLESGREVAALYEDETIEEAARRVAEAIIAGDVDDTDPHAVQEAFVFADGLAAAVDEGQHLLLSGKAAEAAELLAAALAPIEAQGLYQDAPGVSWRVFDDYAQRALYNRLWAKKGQEVRLAPAAYLESLATLSAVHLALGHADAAVQLARQAARLAPLSSQASLHYSSCLLAAERPEDAAEECSRLLLSASTPAGAGMGYLQMAHLQWMRGRTLAARACLQRASELLPTQTLLAALQVAALAGFGHAEPLAAARVKEALDAYAIPFSPTEDVVATLVDVAGAALDEEVFWVARDALRLLVQTTRDDVLHGMLRSIEDEPDR